MCIRNNISWRCIFIFLILTTHVFTACVAQVSFPQISRATAKKTRDVTNKYKVYTFRQVRDRLYKSKPESFLHQQFDNDTLYMMESFILEGNSYWGAIWNRKDSLYYVFDNRQATFPADGIQFLAYWISLIGKWDTARITREYNNYDIGTASNPVFATRIQIKNGKTVVDRYHFYRYFLNDSLLQTVLLAPTRPIQLAIPPNK